MPGVALQYPFTAGKQKHSIKKELTQTYNAHKGSAL